MKTLTYELRFVCPAFLGDAEQNAQWRTPPIKAALRQWWRVAYAAKHCHAVRLADMRRAEAALFGAAGDGKGESGRSLVRLRLDRWDEGKLRAGEWKALPGVEHKEVGRRVAADLYLGYGPVTLPKGQPVSLKGNAAIQAGESAKLSIGLTPGVGADDERRIESALALMHRYGSIGGRSRNGWGSFELQPQDGTPVLPTLDGSVLRPWQDALGLDWPHAIGSDERGALVWATRPCADWRAAMVELAQLKISLRVQLGFRSGKGAASPERRHWMAYPVTNHSVTDWEKRNARLPNSLRYKLRSRADGKVEGIVFHVPALPPPSFRPERRDIDALWLGVHAQLNQSLQRTA
jgi:CRISPR-associated protein Cmr1